MFSAGSTGATTATPDPTVTYQHDERSSLQRLRGTITTCGGGTQTVAATATEARPDGTEAEHDVGANRYRRPPLSKHRLS